MKTSLLVISESKVTEKQEENGEGGNQTQPKAEKHG